MQDKTNPPIFYFFESKQDQCHRIIEVANDPPDQVLLKAGAAVRQDHAVAPEHLTVMQKWRKEEKVRGGCEEWLAWHSLISWSKQHNTEGMGWLKRIVPDKVKNNNLGWQYNSYLEREVNK